MTLDGIVALVAGGASGLGRATADALAQGGATVVVLDLPQSEERVGRESGLTFAAADVRDPQQVEAAVATATGLGDLRVCVNCAGVGAPGRIARRGVPLELDQFRWIIDINLIGTFNVARLAAAAMQRLEPVDGERGVIVNTASIAAFDGQIGQVSYSASKGAIVGMTLPIARDLSRNGIRVCTIAPGIFETPLLAGLPKEAQDSLGKQVPFPSRLGRPAEFAQMVKSIVEIEMLNAETIRLDGAIRMAPK
jgi:NAD(P)-dependent dehydrogenase (short-subunit alcohol dehydrogenase family)